MCPRMKINVRFNILYYITSSRPKTRSPPHGSRLNRGGTLKTSPPSCKPESTVVEVIDSQEITHEIEPCSLWVSKACAEPLASDEMIQSGVSMDDACEYEDQADACIPHASSSEDAEYNHADTSMLTTNGMPVLESVDTTTDT